MVRAGAIVIERSEWNSKRENDLMRTTKVSNAMPALFMTASLAIAALVISTPADARIGVGRPGVGVGRAGIGVGGWRGRLGYGYGRGYGHRGWGYGATALTGATVGYGAANAYGYGYPHGLYSSSPTYDSGGASTSPAAGYALIQFDSGHCEVWSNGDPSGSGWTTLTGGLPNWDAGEAAYHFARAQGVCH